MTEPDIAAPTAPPEQMPDRTGSALASSGIQITPPRHGELFWECALMSISSFGGALPLMYRSVVERKKWLSAVEFTELFGLCQVLPGPNIINLAIALGGRYLGISGAITAILGVTLLPFCIVLALGALYDHYGATDILRHILNGLTPAAAGLLIAMAAKLAMPLFAQKSVLAFFFAILTFIAIACFKLPLVWVLLVLTPAYATLIWRKRQAKESAP